jgi:hypothetical protein
MVEITRTNKIILIIVSIILFIISVVFFILGIENRIIWLYLIGFLGSFIAVFLLHYSMYTKPIYEQMREDESYLSLEEGNKK